MNNGITRTLLRAVVAACAICVPAVAAEDVRVGFNYPLTGPYETQGRDELCAATLAFERINAAGGVLGRRVVPIVKDSRSVGSISAANTAAMIDAGAVMIFGGSASSEAVASGEVAASRGVPYFATLAYSTDVTCEKGNQFLFRECYDSQAAAMVVSKWLTTKYQARKVAGGPGATFAYIVADYNWGITTEEAFRGATGSTDRALHPAVRTRFPGADKPDFIRAVETVRKSSPDVIVVVEFGRHMVLATQVIHALGIDGKAQVVVPNLTLGMAKDAGIDAMAGVVGGLPWYWNDPLTKASPSGADYVAAYRTRYGIAPDTPGASAYTIALQWKDAVERAGSFDGVKVAAAVRGHNFSLLKDAQTWRAFDGQCIQTVHAARVRTKTQILSGGDVDDMFEIVGSMSGTEAFIDERAWSARRADIGIPTALTAKTERATTAVLDPELRPYVPGDVPATAIRSIGSDTLDSLMEAWHAAFAARHPGMTLVAEAKGSGTAPPALLAGKSDLAPMSRDMTEAEIAAFTAAKGYAPTRWRTAIDAVAVIVHRDNPLTAIAIADLDAVYGPERKRGRADAIADWGDLVPAWRGKRIAVHRRDDASGTAAWFREAVMAKGSFKADAIADAGSDTLVERVAADQTAIGFVGLAHVKPSVRVLAIIDAKGKTIEPTHDACMAGAYPLSRYLNIYLDRRPGTRLPPAIEAFLGFVGSVDGQAIVKAKGFFPLRAGMIGANDGTIAADRVSITSSETLAALMSDLVDAYAHTGRRTSVDIRPFASSSAAIAAIVAGQSQIVGSVRKLNAQESASGAYVEKALATDALVIIANPATRIKNLAMADLKAIWSGDGTVMADRFGGGQVAMHPIGNTKKRGLTAVFEGKVGLSGTETVSGINRFVAYGTRTMLAANSNIEVFANVMENQGGIGFVAAAYAESMRRRGAVFLTPSIDGVVMSPSTIADGAWPLSRTMWLIARADAPKHVSDLMGWMVGGSAAGVIRDGGFMPIAGATAAAPVGGAITVLMYSEYIAPSVLASFTAKTGATATIATYESQDELIERLAKGERADVIVASNTIMRRLIADGRLASIDPSTVLNAAKVDRDFLRLPFDPTNAHGYPYLWGTTGILHDATLTGEPSWSWLLAPTGEGKVAIIDEDKPAYGVALLSLGKPIGSTTAADLAAAAGVLGRALGDRRSAGRIAGVEARDQVVAGTLAAAMVYNGDAAKAVRGSKRIRFSIPKEGAEMWVDMMGVSSTAANPRAATAFIDHLLDPAVSAENAAHVGYATPITAAKGLLPKEMLADPVIWPTAAEASRLHLLEDDGTELPAVVPAAVEVPVVEPPKAPEAPKAAAPKPVQGPNGPAVPAAPKPAAASKPPVAAPVPGVKPAAP